MTKNRALLLAGILSLAVAAVGIAFIRLGTRRRIEQERRALYEVGQARLNVFERQLDRSSDAAYALSLLVDRGDRASGFKTSAPGILQQFPAVGAVSLAPDGVVAEFHAPQGIEGSELGRDLFRDPDLHGFASAVRRSGRYSTTPPLSRGKNATVLYGYLPIFRSNVKPEDHFWGFAIVAIRLSALLEASDLSLLPSRGYDYRLSYRDSSSPRPIVVARSAEPDLEDPVRLGARLGSGEWVLSIARRGGSRPTASVARDAALVFALSLLVGLSAYNLLRQPEILRKDLQRRTTRLAEANRQVVQEVVQRERAETQLLYEASHDALTGLPNRAYLLSRLARALERSKREPEHQFALFLIGLDRFKSLNDSLGPLVGDQVLVGTKRRLESCLRPGDILGRVGGDEFAVLLSDARGGDSVVTVARRLQESLGKPLVLAEKQAFVTASIGIAFGAPHYSQPEDLLRDTDLAMRRAKSEGRARHVVFERSMHDRAVMLLNVETDLRRALEREELRVHYQPIVSLSTGAITGFEALVRWQHPERGLIDPDEFIPVAESTGQVIGIDRWVWGEASRRIRALHNRFPKKKRVSISVNVSARHLNEPTLFNEVARTLETSRLSPHLLRMEVTESMMMENAQQARGVLVKLKDLQIALLLDDFGTGYSSLSYLHELPIDVLKIDRSFVKRLGAEGKYSEIVRTIVGLGHGLGMEVIAEGIETAEQLAHLRALGCGYAQGFYFSKPVQTDALDALIASEPRW